jgi:hypothetical protein
MLRIAYNTTKLQANDRKNEKQPATPWSSSAISIPAPVELREKVGRCGMTWKAQVVEHQPIIVSRSPTINILVHPYGSR